MKTLLEIIDTTGTKNILNTPQTMTTLTKKLKQEWIKALRSGKYKQGQNELYSNYDDTYCCLGVLQKIGNIDCDDSELLQDENDRSCVRGLTSKVQQRLAHMNDNNREDFRTIANWIEKYLS